MAMKGFADDVASWSASAMQWAKACQHLVAVIDAVDGGDKVKAHSDFNAAQSWVNKTKAKTVNDSNHAGQELPNSITAITGDGSVDTFLANATTSYKSHLILVGVVCWLFPAFLWIRNCLINIRSRLSRLRGINTYC
jgi:hypothetical protein